MSFSLWENRPDVTLLKPLLPNEVARWKKILENKGLPITGENLLRMKIEEELAKNAEARHPESGELLPTYDEACRMGNENPHVTQARKALPPPPSYDVACKQLKNSDDSLC